MEICEQCGWEIPESGHTCSGNRADILDNLAHVHTCVKCGRLWPHEVDVCRWPIPWLCPDCETEVD
jgi:hypothetical protein